jgi:hypothetical protein
MRAANLRRIDRDFAIGRSGKYRGIGLLLAGVKRELRPFRGVVSDDRAVGPHSHPHRPRIAQNRFHAQRYITQAGSLTVIHSVDFYAQPYDTKYCGEWQMRGGARRIRRE